MNSADTTDREAVLRGARGWQRQRQNSYLNQVWHKEEKTQNRSRLFPSPEAPRWRRRLAEEAQFLPEPLLRQVLCVSDLKHLQKTPGCELISALWVRNKSVWSHEGKQGLISSPTIAENLGDWSKRTLLSWMVWTSLILLPAYIICWSGLQPAGNTPVKHRDAAHVQKLAGSMFLPAGLEKMKQSG